MTSEELSTQYREFCKTQTTCLNCKYADEVSCGMMFSYDAGCKHTFNAAVDLLMVYKEGYKDERIEK